MNGDPYRTPQPADRRVINRAGGAVPPSSSSTQSAAYRQPDEPLASRDEPSRGAPQSHKSSRDSAPKKSRKGLLWTIVALVLIAGIAAVGWIAWSNAKSGVTGIDSSRYQAVFLANGQIYFGKLSSFNDESFKITNVYYPEAQVADGEEDQTDTTTQSNIKLIPIVDGVHGPEDEMILTKSQILYYENLKADSQAARLIDQQSK